MKNYRPKSSMGSDVLFTIAHPESLNNSNKNLVVTGPVDFETAILATGFGKFNWLLLLAAVPATWSSVFDTTTMSYVFPAAQCDLALSLVNKGMLNAITYLGMISSAFLWGFLADTLGRRKLMIYGYLIDGIFNVCCALSTSFSMILLFKFLSGFVVCGPFAILMAFLSEFHCTKYRSRIILSTGLFFSTANLVLPCLAWWILPRNINWHVYGSYVIHSWQVFIFLCSLTMFLAAFSSWLVPESPKFLMSAGRNEEALAVFQTIYAQNTGKPKDTYPIRELVQEVVPVSELGEGGDVVIMTVAPEPCEQHDRNKMQTLQEGWHHIRPLFSPPHISKIILVCVINLGVLLGTNTLRLWLPQFFKTMDEFTQVFDREGTMCEMLEFSTKAQYNQTIVLNPVLENAPCVVAKINNRVYINSIIVSITSLIGYLLAGFLVNMCGKKNLLIAMLLVSGGTGLGIYWSPDSATTVALSSICAGLAGISCTTLVSAVVEIFPTSLRTMTVSLAMMSGRIGSIIGNLLFPLLLTSGCLPPFLLIGGTIIICCILVLTLPSPAKEFK